MLTLLLSSIVTPLFCSAPACAVEARHPCCRWTWRCAAGRPPTWTDDDRLAVVGGDRQHPVPDGHILQRQVRACSTPREPGIDTYAVGVDGLDQAPDDRHVGTQLFAWKNAHARFGPAVAGLDVVQTPADLRLRVRAPVLAGGRHLRPGSDCGMP